LTKIVFAIYFVKVTIASYFDAHLNGIVNFTIIWYFILVI